MRPTSDTLKPGALLRFADILVRHPEAQAWQPAPVTFATSRGEAIALLTARYGLPEGTEFSKRGIVDGGRCTISLVS